MQQFLHYLTFPFLWRGLLIAVEIAGLSLAIAWPLAVLIAVVRMAKSTWIRMLTAPYIWVMRGTPILLQLIFWYNLLPQIGIHVSAPVTAIIGLALNEAAFSGEIIRGGIQSVRPTQRSAAAALGMTNWLVLRRILLPQAFRSILPALANEAIVLIKNTSLASVISVGELTLRSQQIVAANFEYAPVFLASACLYLAATSLVALVQNRSESWVNLEKRGLRMARAPLGHEGMEIALDGDAPAAKAVGRSSDATARRGGGVGGARSAAPGRELVRGFASAAADQQHDADGPFVLVDDVHKSFHGRPVLRGVSLAVERGSVIVLLGPSGAGKSTLLHTINHLEPADSGRITIGGRMLTHRRSRNPFGVTRDLVRARAEARIGMVFQQFNLFDHMTVLQNIMEAPVRVYGVAPSEARDDAMALLAWAGLTGHEGHYPHQLSGGQQQRVAIVRALACRPRLMLFDEPTSALDPELVGEVLRLIRDLADIGMTLIIVTHELAFARDSATRIVFMDQGRIVEQGPPESLLTRPREERTRRFLNLVTH